jgi:hypothetical protein
VPRSEKKKARKAASRPVAEAFDLLRPGMPAKDSIRRVVNFVSPQNDHYQIIKTTEKDPYDPVPKPRKKRGPES